MSKKILEAEIEAYFVKCVEEQLGGVALKLEVKGRRGWLDRLVLLPNGAVCFAELKTKKGRLSALQKRRIATLKNLGHCCWVLYTLEDVDFWVDALQRKHSVPLIRALGW